VFGKVKFEIKLTVKNAQKHATNLKLIVNDFLKRNNFDFIKPSFKATGDLLTIGVFSMAPIYEVLPKDNLKIPQEI
jgi:hypothetical protein